jgi:hypothetical protein
MNVIVDIVEYKIDMKKQIQRIQQLIDKLPNGKIRKEMFKKLLKLKTKK